MAFDESKVDVVKELGKFEFDKGFYEVNIVTYGNSSELKTAMSRFLYKEVDGKKTATPTRLKSWINENETEAKVKALQAAMSWYATK